MKKIGANWWLIGSGVAVALVLIAGAFWWLKNQPTPSPTITPQGEITVEGSLVCLPKKGSGPQTLECAYGLQSSGKYYALDMSGMADHQLFDYTFDDVLRIQGELFSPDPDTTYDIEGTIKVKQLELISGAS